MKTNTRSQALIIPLVALTVCSLRSTPMESAATDSSPPPNHDATRPKKDRSHSLAPAENYTLAQATSDKAQLHTIAFNGLAFLTGDFGASTFIPPGKVCDFFGFQYMRDIDAAAKGHNPVFLNRVAGNVLQTLTSEQKEWFTALAAEQLPQLETLAELRLPLIQAFHRNADGQLPASSSGLNRAAVINHVGKIFALDAALSLRRAEVMGKVATSLTAEQKAYFSKMKFGDFTTWPEVDADTIKDRPGRGQPKLFGVSCMTYASEFFSWYAGSEAADVYFCPERHGTYFGGFYMKDMPAMGQKNYDISTSVTGDSGEAFVDEVLTPAQRKLVVATVDQQRAALKEVVSVRTAMSRELRKALAGGQPDRDKVVALGRRYGELDGEMSWYYATAYAAVNKTLTADQRTSLLKLRNLDGYVSAPYYLYSDAVKSPKPVTGSDAFFYPPRN